VTLLVPDGARELLGEAYDPISHYADLLVAVGVPRGLIGPHEAPRLWERHLLNSAAVVDLFPRTATVVDLGSGAGLPGVVLALLVPTLRVVLLDATKRRTDFLSEVVAELDLADRVEVVWGRAESLPSFNADVVVARAVAPLSKLASWSMPHLIGGGSLLALKGESAAEELNRDAAGLRRLGVISHELLSLPSLGSDQPAQVIRLVKGSRTGPAGPPKSRRPAARSTTRATAGLPAPTSARRPGRRTLPRPDGSTSAGREGT
jgi:16S rRNA (guanine527-N7)-methyltransferase